MCIPQKSLLVGDKILNDDDVSGRVYDVILTQSKVNVPENIVSQAKKALRLNADCFIQSHLLDLPQLLKLVYCIHGLLRLFTSLLLQNTMFLALSFCYCPLSFSVLLVNKFI
jgi:hypothetical protein